MITVGAFEAKTHLSALLERVEAGEEIVIARAGTPIARLVPLAPPARRAPGRWRHIAPPPDGFFFDPLPEEELRMWETDPPHDR